MFTRKILTCLLLVSTGCHPPPSPAPAALEPGLVNGTAALTEACSLANVYPRDAGTPGAREAAEYLLARLQTIDIQSSIDLFEDACPGGTATFRNVIGIIPGRQGATDWIVLGSHYDTKAGISAPFEGANDSASSSGLLLELARLIRAGAPLPFNTMVAFFDGEECQKRYGPHDGIHGSRHLARTLLADGRAPLVRAVIILDMVGDRDLSVTLPRNGTPALLSAAFRAAAAEGVRDKFSLYPSDMLDDHQPFLECGMPAVDIIDFEYGSAPGKNDYWHTPADTTDKLSAGSLATVGRVTVRMLNDLAAEYVKIHR